MKTISLTISIIIFMAIFSGCGPSKKEISRIQTKIIQLQEQLDTLNFKLEEAERAQSWFESKFFDSDEVKKIKKSIKSTKKKIAELEYEISGKDIDGTIKYYFSKNIVIGVFALVIIVILVIGIAASQ